MRALGLLISGSRPKGHGTHTLLLNFQLVRVPLESSSNPLFFLLHLDFDSNGHFTKLSSFTYFKPSLMLNETLSFSLALKMDQI